MNSKRYLYFNQRSGAPSLSARTFCILEDYIQYGQIKGKYANLSLRSEKPIDKKFAKYEFIEIDKAIKNTKVTIKQKIYIMTNILDEELLDYNIRKFDELVVANKYTDEDAAHIFKALISDEKNTHNLTTNKYSELKSQLLNTIYSPSKKASIISSLDSIKQTNFNTIEEYYIRICELANKYGKIYKLDEESLYRKKEEMFYRGLGPYTEMEICDSFTDDSSLDEVLEYLLRKEEKLITTASRLQKQLPTNEGSNISKQPQNSGWKWCAYHKKCNHDTKDCNKYNNRHQKLNEVKNTDTNKNLIIKETRQPSLNEIAVEVKIKGQEFTAVIDTGSKNSYIAENLVNMLKLKSQEDKPITAIFGNGSSETISKSTETQIVLKDNKELSELFYVHANCPVDIILGFHFLVNNDACINLAKGELKIDGHSIKLKGVEKTIEHELEKELTESLCLLEGDNKRTKEDLINFLEMYSEHSKSFSYMNVDPIKLHIKHPIPVLQSKNYSIPYKYVDKGYAELNRLVSENII